MPQFRLNHVCHRPGCEGVPGDVVSVSNSDVQYLLSVEGGAVVEGVKPARSHKENEEVGPGDSGEAKTGKRGR